MVGDVLLEGSHNPVDEFILILMTLLFFIFGLLRLYILMLIHLCRNG